MVVEVVLPVVEEGHEEMVVYMEVEAAPSVVEWDGEMPCLHSGLGQA